MYSVISSISPNELFDQSNLVRRSRRKRRRWGSETQSEAQRSGEYIRCIEYSIKIDVIYVTKFKIILMVMVDDDDVDDDDCALDDGDDED